MSGRALTSRPKVRIEVVRDDTASMRSDEGFIRVRRLLLRNHYEGGEHSREYRYDCAEREAIDAVGIVLFDREGRVCLRSSIRPPLAMRPGYVLALQDEEPGCPTLYEIPAGLIEIEERGEDGLRACCARETLEEVGLHVEPGAFVRLGPGVFLTPGLCAEKIHFFAAEVDGARAVEPTMDGSPVEERATIEWVPLEEALAACGDGRVMDIKTELSLRRLAESPWRRR
jgi:ADP-ribose pyrophosphatase